MPSTTASRSASSNTITGALPPSSRCTRFRVADAAFATSLPVATSPVSETIATPGWRTMPAPTGSPAPVIAVLLDDRCELEQHLAPLSRRAVGPDLVVRLARSFHRAVDVLRRALRHCRDDLAEGRVLDLLHIVACAVDPLAADEHLVASKRGLHMSLLVSALSRAVRRWAPREG